jgi:hypothetical protein
MQDRRLWVVIIVAALIVLFLLLAPQLWHRWINELSGL